MPDFSQRSYQKELLDGTGISFEDIKRNMQELDTINTLLGGHAITIQGLKALLRGEAMTGRELHIAEIGCGGGDNIFALQRWCLRNNISCRFTGIDINPECIAFASSKKKKKGVYEWVCCDYRQADFGRDLPDIVFSSLFCHHFSNAELESMMDWCARHSKLGFFINDLHRHPLAFHSIRLLTRLFSRSYLVKNDAPLSVLRGFRKNEWVEIMKKAGLRKAKIRWKWAFRWLVIAKN